MYIFQLFEHFTRKIIKYSALIHYWNYFLPKEFDAMKSEENFHGQAMALDNMAKTYEYMANLTKASETLETVSLTVHVHVLCII